MIFRWFDAGAAKKFGQELAEEFVASVSPGAQLSQNKFEAKVKSAVAQMDRRVAEFTKQHRLNAYQKAQLGNAFKWALRDAGYDADYADKLSDLLMLRLQ
jgi:hypothetical protein